MATPIVSRRHTAEFAAQPEPQEAAPPFAGQAVRAATLATPGSLISRSGRCHCKAQRCGSALREGPFQSCKFGKASACLLVIDTPVDLLVLRHADVAGVNLLGRLPHRFDPVWLLGSKRGEFPKGSQRSFESSAEPP